MRDENSLLATSYNPLTIQTLFGCKGLFLRLSYNKRIAQHTKASQGQEHRIRLSLTSLFRQPFCRKRDVRESRWLRLCSRAVESLGHAPFTFGMHWRAFHANLFVTDVLFAPWSAQHKKGCYIDKDAQGGAKANQQEAVLCSQ